MCENVLQNATQQYAILWFHPLPTGNQNIDLAFKHNLQMFKTIQYAIYLCKQRPAGTMWTILISET